jgi:hypothetical protein
VRSCELAFDTTGREDYGSAEAKSKTEITLLGDYTMRLTNLAASILTLVVAGYISITTMARAGSVASQDSQQRQIVDVFATGRDDQHRLVTDLTKDEFKNSDAARP